MKNIKLGTDTTISPYCNMYNCQIGDNTKIGPFVEIQNDVIIGNNCKIQSHSFICEGVTIEDNVFIGHGVIFCNDRRPKSCNTDGSLKKKEDWTLEPVLVKSGASIGSNATIMCGIIIGKNTMIGAGSVVTKNIPDGETWAGNPARKIHES